MTDLRNVTADRRAPCRETLKEFHARMRRIAGVPDRPTGRRVGSWIKWNCGDRVFDESDSRWIGRIDFIQGGGSLLLVLDEEKRQSLTTTGVNDFLAPFGIRLTPDTPYIPNVGAIAKAGEVNRSDRELPYDGGRSVEGGTPFAFQLDRDGKPAQPYAAWKKVKGGGRMIVLAEGMASLFLGSASGQRLAAVNNSDTDRYWGKDSGIFMEEILSWLAHQTR